LRFLYDFQWQINQSLILGYPVIIDIFDSDFTCRAEGKDLNNRTIAGVRGGVYWESGYAFALGKPVIQTCEDNEEARDRIHFDLKQYPTIYWKPDELSLSIRTGQFDNPNLVEMLTNRILFLSGRGTYKP
jgi:hypothetical protein